MQDRSGFGGGPTYMILWLIDLFIDLFVTRDWFIPLYDMHVIILCLIANIHFHWSKPVHHSGTFFVSPIHSVIFVLSDIHLVSMLEIIS